MNFLGSSTSRWTSNVNKPNKNITQTGFLPVQQHSNVQYSVSANQGTQYPAPTLVYPASGGIQLPSMGGSSVQYPVSGAQGLRHLPPAGRIVSSNQQYYQQLGGTVAAVQRPVPLAQYTGRVMQCPGSSAQYPAYFVQAPVSALRLCTSNIQTSDTGAQYPYSVPVVHSSEDRAQYTESGIQSSGCQTHYRNSVAQTSRSGRQHVRSPSYFASSPVQYPITTAEQSQPFEGCDKASPNYLHCGQESVCSTSSYNGQQTAGPDSKLLNAGSLSGNASTGSQTVPHHTVLKLIASEQQQKKQPQKQNHQFQGSSRKIEDATTFSNTQVQPLEYFYY